MNLLQPPDPLTRRQWTIFWVLALVCAATRFLAMAKSIWGWDEALFCLGMRAYDVSSHHPHPPGFPVYMAMARLARLVIGSDFRALQAVNLTAGALLFPSIFLLARELRFRFNIAAIAATLCAFFPNVWFFGGTALSDVPSIVMATLAAGLLFRGCRREDAYLLGVLLLAAAIGIRPQNVLIGFAPGLIATWYRAKSSWRDVVFAIVVGVIVVGAAFWFAAQATGDLDRYARSVREHSEYISRVDSFRSPDRPPLWRLADRFFILQYQSRPLSIITSLFVIAAVITAIRRRDRPVLLAALTFVPVAVMTWLFLDRFSVNRFSIGYAPLFAILAAYGIAAVARKYDAFAGAALIAAFAIWTWPALTPVRNEKSPPVRAVEAAVARLDPARDQLYVGFSMVPFVEYLAPQLTFTRVAEERGMPLTTNGHRAVILAEARGGGEGGEVFRRERGHLFNITRHYYYDVALRTLAARPRFVSGWSAPERRGQFEWRYMSGTAAIQLPRVDGPAKLRLAFDVPAGSNLTVTFNGTVIEQMQRAPAYVDREYDVQGEVSNLLRIDNPGPLKLGTLVWGPRRR
jgi:4-amino-4-deoxy-L-arabinose transferase-like glycosyltransferase